MKRYLIYLLLACICVALFGTSSSAAYPVAKLLKEIPVVPESSSSQYARDLFPHWLSGGKKGCTTREDVLIAEGRSLKRSGCKVQSGIWNSRYDGRTFTSPSKLDIDHFVPLAQAYRSGASKWDLETRKAFANDQGYAGSLIAVSATTNRSKSDQDPAQWMPPNKSFKCKYVGTWIAVKWRWSLSADKSEKNFLAKTIKACKARADVSKPRKAYIGKGQDLEKGGGQNTPDNPKTGLDPRFSTCAAAKAAGYGPYYRGKDLEYAWYRDGDNDGIACE